MRIGLIGAGNMGGALARGLGEPLLVADVDGERAEALAAEIGGEAVGGNGEVGERADLVILAHKPGQLDEVAESLGGEEFAVISILGGTPVSALERAYRGRPVHRFMPNIAAEARQGVLCYAPGQHVTKELEAEVLELFGRLGVIVPLSDALMDPATALMGCGPAFFALVVEALADAGVRHGLQQEQAARLVAETMAGTAAVLREGGYDTAGLRKRVTSPGGSTARGLAALERGGVRSAFADAVDAVAGPAHQ